MTGTGIFQIYSKISEHRMILIAWNEKLVSSPWHFVQSCIRRSYKQLIVFFFSICWRDELSFKASAQLSSTPIISPQLVWGQNNKAPFSNKFELPFQCWRKDSYHHSTTAVKECVRKGYPDQTAADIILTGKAPKIQ